MIDTSAAHGEPSDSVEVVRSQERLRVRTERVPTRIARLEKFIVTEQRTFTVEVRHEAVRLVYRDLPAGGPGVDQAVETQRRSPELVLSEEQVEIRTVVVPVERVRMLVDEVTDHRDVVGTVSTERVGVERGSAVD